ncbi:unnamed protein product [Paramecium sonneborni]|uniref:Transmembrane protein n=1 Tax=Paramecium sonneborni TaxID=65129 RepID=A0A8S1PH70_9CILI|nr:unnamed protein product [Paramecium sonneborni]
MIQLNTYEQTYWVSGYQCCVIIYAFISFGLILVSVFNQSKLMDEAPQFYTNWNNYLIEDIQIKQNCDHGFHNVLNFTWPGTEKGCDCTQSNGTGNYKYNNYYYMECSQFMLAENCHPIAQMESRNFQYLPFISKKIVKGFKICAKMSPFTAIQAFSIQENIEMYKKCGNIWNVPITSQCPISHFVINNDNNGIQIGDSDLYYNYQRVESEQLPITQFTIGYNSICYKNTEIFTFYYLDNLIDYQCDIEDDRFQKVKNNIQYSDLLKVNEVLDQYTKLFKNTEIQQRNMNLFYQKLTKFQYNKSDLCKFNDLDFIYHLNSYINDNLMDIQLAAQVIVGIQAGVFGFLIPMISAISLIGCNFKFNSINQKGSHYKDLFGFWLGIKMIGETVCTIILAIDMGYQKYMLNNLEAFINADCSDSLTLIEMTKFYNQYEIKVYNYVLLNFILCIITNLTDIYLTYLMCRDKHNQGIITMKKNQENLYPKMYTSTHPDEILIKSKAITQNDQEKDQLNTKNDQEKDQLKEIKIPDDDMVVRIPDE